MRVSNTVCMYPPTTAALFDAMNSQRRRAIESVNSGARPATGSCTAFNVSIQVHIIAGNASNESDPFGCHRDLSK